VTNLVVLHKGVSDVDTSGLQESEHHATAKDELVDLRNKREDRREVVRIEDRIG
jgi:hypothetical protein